MHDQTPDNLSITNTIFKCVEDFIMYDGLKTFTKSYEYKGYECPFCWILVNDQSNEHYLAPRHIEKYFKIMGEE